MSDLTKKIKSRAVELGFSKIGVAPVKIINQESKTALLNWVQKGFNADMHWMNNNLEKRINPELLLKNAKSIICVAINYYYSHNNEKQSLAKIAKYALGKDYHNVLSQKLKLLLQFIKDNDASTNGLFYVDTGPVMEKYWAMQSGIGWIGKHSNLITREYGSWVVLGEIIIDLELEYDLPSLTYCGTCNKCVEACPTKAIVNPYTIDSTKCISYLNIEHKGNFENVDLHGWLFGCDICQDVCPWNKFKKESTEEDFAPFELNKLPNVLDILNLTEEDFKIRYKNSPIKRAKLKGLQRNAKAIIDYAKSKN